MVNSDLEVVIVRFLLTRNKQELYLVLDGGYMVHIIVKTHQNDT